MPRPAPDAPREGPRGLTALVTVGTTKFDALVAAVDTVEVGEALASRGFSRLVLQYGDVALEPTVLRDAARAAAGGTASGDEEGDDEGDEGAERDRPTANGAERRGAPAGEGAAAAAPAGREGVDPLRNGARPGPALPRPPGGLPGGARAVWLPPSVRRGAVTSVSTAGVPSVAAATGALPPLDAARNVAPPPRLPSVRGFRYAPSLAEEILGADLVVSHAGAGSLFEALRAGRVVLAVPNPILMDDHQVELAERLAGDGVLATARVDGIARAIRALDPASLAPYRPGDAAGIIAHIDREAGLA